MPRNKTQPTPTRREILRCVVTHCPVCGRLMYRAYNTYRILRTLDGVVGYTLHVRRCVNKECERFHRAYRPEREGSLALPEHEFGLDVVALVGALRHREHRTVVEIHRELLVRGIEISERSVLNQLERYEELLALSLEDTRRLGPVLEKQGRVILAIDGLAPQVGQEVLWLLRDCLSGEVLLARALLSAAEDDLAPLVREVAKKLSVPIVGVISDGQHSIRNAVASALPDVPHQLCHFHYLREAATPLYEADRHAKKELKKRVRGVRPIERKLEKRSDEQAAVIGQYCTAVRSALTDDGAPAPLDAAGLRLHERLSAISDSLERVEEKGGSLPSSGASGT
jgi:hypothetical protein